MSVSFLTLDEVLALHADQIERYGGHAGVRDRGLLSSAVGMAEVSFEGEFLHGSIHEMAAAYLFHICKNHPFLDGNKRTALASCLAFLWINDLEVVAEPTDIAELVLGVAGGKTGKAQVAVYLAGVSRQAERGGERDRT